SLQVAPEIAYPGQQVTFTPVWSDEEDPNSYSLNWEQVEGPTANYRTDDGSLIITAPDVTESTIVRVRYILLRDRNIILARSTSVRVTGNDVTPEAPGAPTVEIHDVNSLIARWGPVPTFLEDGARVSGYVIRYREDDPAAEWTSYTINFQHPYPGHTIQDARVGGIRYEVQVRAFDHIGRHGPWSAPGYGTTASAPDRPGAPTVATVDADTLLISWAEPDDGGLPITHYRVRTRTPLQDEPDYHGAAWSEHANDVTSAHLTLSGLNTDAPYQAQVRAVNGVGPGEWSAAGSGRTASAPTVPDAPDAPTVARIDDTSIRVSWTEPVNTGGSSISSYVVRHREQGGSWLRSQATGATHLSIWGLNPDTVYEAQVHAVNAQGSSGWSNIGSGSTAAPQPEETLDPSSGSDGAVIASAAMQLSWIEPANGGNPVRGYEIRFRAANGSDWNYLYVLDVETSATIEVQVRPVTDAALLGDVAEPTDPSARPALPNAPDLAPASSNGDRALRVSWNEPANSGPPILSYDVRYREAGGQWSIVTVAAPNTETLIEGLKPWTKYLVRVRATNVNGHSNWSESVSARTLRAP
ncbi:MAG: hypothetical protein F4Z35_02175, partial [Dehalococcoidia bacterium]|nr:hypothetical protein [Dehalococcoidia bacterium]